MINMKTLFLPISKQKLSVYLPNQEPNVVLPGSQEKLGNKEIT